MTPQRGAAWAACEFNDGNSSYKLYRMLYTTLFQHASVKEVEKLSFRKLSHVGERRDFFGVV
jgi:hypothetical protein